MNSTLQSRISLIFITAHNENGDQVTRTKTLNNVKGNASDEDLVSLATSLTDLQQFPLFDAVRNDSYSIM